MNEVQISGKVERIGDLRKFARSGTFWFSMRVVTREHGMLNTCVVTQMCDKLHDSLKPGFFVYCKGYLKVARKSGRLVIVVNEVQLYMADFFPIRDLFALQDKMERDKVVNVRATKEKSDKAYSLKDFEKIV